MWAADPAAAPVWQTWLPALLGVLITALGALVGTVWVKRLSRRLDDATATKTVSESRKADAETVSLEVATARSLIAEIKAMLNDQRSEFLLKDAEKTEKIKELSVQFSENREQLRAIRSAFSAHEMWDRDAVAALRHNLPGFPDPPPVAFD